MGCTRTPGLFQRGGVWHIDKQIGGRRICESTGSSSFKQAIQILAHRIDQARKEEVFGIRPEVTFRQAAMNYVKTEKIDSMNDAIDHIKRLDPFVGKMQINHINMQTLAAFIKSQEERGLKNRTINIRLKTVRRILNLAAEEWRHENGLTWLLAAPKIKLLDERDSRKPYPISYAEESRLFAEFPIHLRRMALFKVNTGTREGEVCNLRWEWEAQVPELGIAVSVIPAEFVKNKEDRLVVLNRIAASVIEEVRGIHDEFVFTYSGKPIKRMNSSAWRHARVRAGLPQVRVHDMKHTFGMRLRAAGVSLEDRKDLLGHKSKDITTHYSAAQLQNLVDAANKVCDIDEKSRKSPARIIFKRKS